MLPENKDQSSSILKSAIKFYLHYLKIAPLITKSVTSAFTAVTGNVIAQLIKQTGFSWTSVRSFFFFGLLIVGPILHYFYAYLGKLVPASSKNAWMKYLIIDRLFFGPPFLLLSLYVLSMLQGSSHMATIIYIRKNFTRIFYNNIRFFTVFQWINFNFVPVQFRVLYGNIISMIWNIYLAKVQK